MFRQVLVPVTLLLVEREAEGGFEVEGQKEGSTAIYPLLRVNLIILKLGLKGGEERDFWWGGRLSDHWKG